MRAISSATATINIATSKSHTDPVQAQSVSWMFLSDRLKRVVPGSKAGRGYVAAQLPDGRRTDDRVITTSLLVFDIDNKANTATQADLVKIITDSGYLAILHSTYSHTQECPRFRLLLAISEPIMRSQHKSVLLHVAKNLGIYDFMDTACTDPSRYFYLPRCPKERVDDYVYWSTDGDPVNVEACLVRINSDGNSIPRLSIVGPKSDPIGWEENKCNIAKLQELLSHCSADCDYEVWRNIIWAVCSLEWQSGKKFVEEWSRTSSRHWSEFEASDSQAEIDALVPAFDSSRGLTIGTLVARAKGNGWQPKSHSSFSSIKPIQSLSAGDKNFSTSK